MNKDQVKGRARQVKGAVKEATGKVLDNERTDDTLSRDPGDASVRRGR